MDPAGELAQLRQPALEVPPAIPRPRSPPA
jgi:hypothetical protein